MKESGECEVKEKKSDLKEEHKKEGISATKEREREIEDGQKERKEAERERKK